MSALELARRVKAKCLERWEQAETLEDTSACWLNVLQATAKVARLTGASNSSMSADLPCTLSVYLYAQATGGGSGVFKFVPRPRMPTDKTTSKHPWRSRWCAPSDTTSLSPKSRLCNEFTTILPPPRKREFYYLGHVGGGNIMNSIGQFEDTEDVVYSTLQQSRQDVDQQAFASPAPPRGMESEEEKKKESDETPSAPASTTDWWPMPSAPDEGGVIMMRLGTTVDKANQDHRDATQLAVSRWLFPFHRMGVVHADLRWSNFVRFGNQVQPVDFGLSGILVGGGGDIDIGNDNYNDNDIDGPSDYLECKGLEPPLSAKIQLSGGARVKNLGPRLKTWIDRKTLPLHVSWRVSDDIEMLLVMFEQPRT